ncbi:MAG: hypothetical protein ACUVTU_07630 [Desulfurispora sp.]|uniref:hypothetical protein n=1 Tax=Desulfurispora sp. TaxID=3014275 RepID=UPI00404A0923
MEILDLEPAEALPVETPAIETAAASPVENPATTDKPAPIEMATPCPDQTVNPATREAENSAAVKQASPAGKPDTVSAGPHTAQQTIPQGILEYYKSLGLDEQTIQRYYGHRFYLQSARRPAFTTPLRCQKRIQGR